MSTISTTDALKYASQAGFTGQSLTTIIQIAEAESELNTDAYNGNDPYGGSYGILQINGSHMGETFQYGNHTYIMSPTIAKNPALAFAFAYHLSNGGTYFGDWSTYTNGEYLSTSAVGSPVSSIAVSNPVTDVQSLSDAWNAVQQPTFWVRVGIGTLGIVSVIVGAATITASFEVGGVLSRSSRN